MASANVAPVILHIRHKMEGQWLASRAGHFTPYGRTPVAQYVKRVGGPISRSRRSYRQSSAESLVIQTTY